MSLIKIWFWGAVGADVKELQKFLNQHGYIMAKRGAGSPGRETAYFGLKTKKALINFQKAGKIKPANGIFNLATRAVVNVMANPPLAQSVATSSSVKTAGPALTSTSTQPLKISVSKTLQVYPIKGTATGISGAVALLINGEDALVVIPGSGNEFNFSKPLADGSAYNVTAFSLIIHQRCNLTNNKGVVKGAPVTDIKLECYAAQSSGSPAINYSLVPSGAGGSGGGSTYNVLLSYEAGTCGSIAGTALQSVSRGGSGSAITAIAASGCRFVDWSDGSTANPRTDTNVTADLSVTANYETIINAAAIAGVTAPVIGAVPVSALAETSQYTAAVSWSPAAATFAPGTAYTATVNIIPKTGYTLVGVPANFFTVAGATATSLANSGVVRAVFPSTDATINYSTIGIVPKPTAGTASFGVTSDYAQFNVTSTWPGIGTFAPATVYTATVAITAKPGYTLVGVPANFFLVTGATATNSPNSGAVSATFPVTSSTIATAAIAGVTAPVARATPVNSIASTTEYTATISWSPVDSTFAAGTAYTATITITPKAGYTLYGLPANFFTVAGATAVNSINAGVVTATFPTTANPGPAVLSIDSVQVNGQYVAGVVLYEASIDYHITVTQAGNYSFTVAPSPNNGYRYVNKSGYAGLGALTINSVGSGTPVSVGTDSFTISGNSTSLGFTVATIDPPTIVYNGVTYQYLPDQYTTSFDNAVAACDSLVFAGFSDWYYPADMDFECYIRANGLAQRLNYHWYAQAESKWPCTNLGVINPTLAGYRCVRVQ